MHFFFLFFFFKDVILPPGFPSLPFTVTPCLVLSTSSVVCISLSGPIFYNHLDFSSALNSLLVSFLHVYLALSLSLVVRSLGKLKRCEEGNKSKFKKKKNKTPSGDEVRPRQASASQRIVKTPRQTLSWWLIEDWQAHESGRESAGENEWGKKGKKKRDRMEKKKRQSGCKDGS